MRSLFNQIFLNSIEYNRMRHRGHHGPVSLGTVILVVILGLWFVFARHIPAKIQYVIASLPVISSVILFFRAIESWKAIILVAGLSVIALWFVKNHSTISTEFDDRSNGVKIVPDYMFICGALVTAFEIILLK